MEKNIQKIYENHKGTDANFEMKQENQKKSGSIPAHDNLEDAESAKISNSIYQTKYSILDFDKNKSSIIS